jgi:hypothetical protein
MTDSKSCRRGKESRILSVQGRKYNDKENMTEMMTLLDVVCHSASAAFSSFKHCYYLNFNFIILIM